MQSFTTILHLALTEITIRFAIYEEQTHLTLTDFFEEQLNHLVKKDLFEKMNGENYIYDILDEISLVPECSLEKGYNILKEITPEEDLEFISFTKAKKIIENHLLIIINQNIKEKCFIIDKHFDNIILGENRFLSSFNLLALFYFYKINKLY